MCHIRCNLNITVITISTVHDKLWSSVTTGQVINLVIIGCGLRYHITRHRLRLHTMSCLHYQRAYKRKHSNVRVLTVPKSCWTVSHQSWLPAVVEADTNLSGWDESGRAVGITLCDFAGSRSSCDLLNGWASKREAASWDVMHGTKSGVVGSKVLHYFFGLNVNAPKTKQFNLSVSKSYTISSLSFAIANLVDSSNASFPKFITNCFRVNNRPFSQFVTSDINDAFYKDYKILI